MTQDKITTGDRAFARLLLGGSAVVTVRERSTLTITEVPGKSTIALDSGKIALAVAREKMKPGDSVEIRTPNAIAGVRGTVVVAEVLRASAQIGGGDGVVTTFSVISGSVEAFSFDPGTGRPVSPPQTIGVLQRFSAAGSATPRVDPIPPSQVSQVTSGLSSSSMQHTAAANAEELKEQAVQTTVTLMNTILGTGTTTTDTTTGETTQAASEPEKTEEPSNEPPVSNKQTVQNDAVTPTSSCTSCTCTNTCPTEETTTDVNVADGSDHTGNSDTSHGKLTQSGGTLAGTGILSFSSADSTWTAGTMTGTGTTKIETGAALAISGADDKTLDGGRTLDNHGTVNWSGGQLLLGGSATIANRGTWDVQGDLEVASTATGETATFDNHSGATIQKSSGAGAATIGANTAGAGTVTFNNAGTVDVQAGTLVLADGGTHSGSFIGDGTLEFSGGTHSLTGTSSVTTSDVVFSGGTSTIAAGATFNPTASSTTISGGTVSFDSSPTLSGSLTLSGGTLGGSGTVTVNGATTWSGGTMAGTGNTTTAGGLTLSGAGDKTLTQRTLSASGPTSLDSGRLVMGGSATLTNTSTFTIAGDLDIASDGSGATFTNAGGATLEKSTGTGVATIGSDPGAVTFNNDGTVQVKAGTLRLQDGGTHSGSFTGAGTLEFSGGTHTLTGISIVTTSGVVFSGGTSTIAAGATFNPTASSTTISGATVNFDNSPTLDGSLTLSGGTLGGTGTLTVNGATTWSGGTTTGAGTTTTTGGLTISGAADKSLVGGRTLSTPGATWSAGRLLLGGGATLTNSGTFTIQGDLDIASSAGGATATVTSTGTVTKSTGTGTATIGADPLGAGAVDFNNQGIVHVESGTLQIGASGDGGSSRGRLTVDAGATLVAGSSAILVNVSSGTHAIANTSGQAIYDLTGSATTTKTVDGVSLVVGTDRPLRGAGACPSCAIPDALVTASGATVDTKQAVKLDTALLEVSKPVAALSSGSSLTSGTDLVKLVQKAELSGDLGTDALARLTGGSSLTVSGSNLVNVAGGSLVEIKGGNLLSLDGGSTLTIASGPLVMIAGSSVFRFTGALGAFGASGTNKLRLDDAPSCDGPCGVVLTDPETGAKFGIQLTGGASAGNVVVKSDYDPFTGLSGSNTVVDATNVALGETKALIVLDGASSKLRLGDFPSLTLPPDYAVNANETYSSVTHSSGTLSGGSTLTVLDSYSWSGGTQTTTSGITEITSGATLDISGSGAKSLSRRINNSGTTTWTDAGDITAGGSGGTLVVFDNKSGAIFDIQNNQTFNGDGGSLETFTNAGTLKKMVATGTTTFGSGLIVDNSGAVDAQSGSITFNSTGTHTGTFNAASGKAITFTNNQTFNGGTAFTGPGVNEMSAGSSSFNNYVTADNFKLSGGTLSGTAHVSGSGFTWTGGTMSGGGTLTSTGTFTIDGATVKSISGYTLANTGSMTWTSGASNIATGGSGGTLVVLDNRAGGLFLVQNDASFTGDGGSAETFKNAGTVRKTTASGTTTFNSGVTFDNAGGTLDVQTGSLTVAGSFNHTVNSAITAGTVNAGGGGSSSGSLALSAGTTLNLTGGTHSLAGGTTITGAGLYRVSGGTASVSGTVAGQTLEIASGTLSGSGALYVTGSMTWSGGNMSTTSGTTVILAGKSLTISGGDAKGLGRQITNAGTTTWTGGAINANSSSGTLFVVDNLRGGVFDIQTDGTISGDGGSAETVRNAGTLKKSAGAGTTTIGSGVTFTNQASGGVDIQTGRLAIGGGGTSNGGFMVASGTSVDFTAGYTLDNGTVISGAGAARLVSSPTLTISGDVRADNVELPTGATLTGTGTLRIGGTLTWTGGIQGNTSGATVIASGANLAISGDNAKALQRTNTNFGTTTWSGLGDINAGASSGTFTVFDNKTGALFHIQNDRAFTGDGGSQETFANTGTVRKTTATGTTTFGSTLTFNNSGLVDIQSGALALQSPGTHGGTFTAASGSTITFTGNQTFNSGTTFTGAGQNRMTAGSSSMSGVITADNFELAGGTLSGSPRVDGSGFTWTGGTMSGGGTLNATGTLTLSGAGTKTISGYTISANGTTTWQDAGNISVGGSGGTLVVFENRAGGLFLMKNDQTFSGDGGSLETFKNAGTLRKTTAAGATTFGSGVSFDNPGGTLDIQTGSLTLSGPFNHSGYSAVMAGTISAGGGGSSSGTLALNSGTTVNLTGGTHSLATATAITGAGLYRVNGGTLSVSGSVYGNKLSLASGAIDGTGTLYVTDSLAWSGGSMQGTSGGTTVLSGSSLTITGAGAKTLQRQIANLGTATWGTDAGNLSAGGSGGTLFVIDNKAGALFHVQNDSTITGDGGSNETVRNAGTLRKTTATGTTTIATGVTFTNLSGGTVDIQSGRLALTGGGTSNGAFTLASGASVDFTAGYTLDTGTAISGAGSARIVGSSTLTVTGTVSAQNLEVPSGTLTGSGTLTVTGTMTWSGGSQTGSGSTVIDTGATLAIQGTGPGLQRLITNKGTATWSGASDINAGGSGGTFTVFDNKSGALFLIQNDRTFNGDGGSTETVSNAGTLRKTIATGVTSFGAGLTFDNSGAIEVQSGTITFSSGGTNTGRMTVGAGGTVVAATSAILDNFSSGTHAVATGASDAIYDLTAATSTDKPLHGGAGAAVPGALLTTSGSTTLKTNQLLKLTTATMTTSTSLMSIGGTSTVTSLGNAIALSNASLTVNSGAAFSVSGGVLNVPSAKLLAVASSMTISSGALIKVLGGGVFVITGPAFGDLASGASLNLSAAPSCAGSCTMTVSGYNIKLTNGASATVNESSFTAFTGAGTVTRSTSRTCTGAGAAARSSSSPLASIPRTSGTIRSARSSRKCRRRGAACRRSC
ncbi:MAG: hypothetical protein HYU41_20320 [Candidatus Rokubacteria bacterium]|nr:hypothetical protein [Candidatus Rokubacteria bacterium]